MASECTYKHHLQELQLLLRNFFWVFISHVILYHTTHGLNEGDQESWDLLQMRLPFFILPVSANPKTKPKIFRRVQ